MQKLKNSPGKLWLSGLASVLLLLAPGAQAQLIDGLVAHWNFDDNLQDTLGVYHGEAQGTVAFVAGQPGFGSALSLDGSNHVLVVGGEPDDLAFQGGNMSIAGWFRVNTFDTSWQALVAKGEGTNWRVHRRDATSNLTMSGGQPEAAAGGPAINDGNWHHFAAIVDTANGSLLYINGTLAEHNTGVPNLAANGQRVRIGENPDAQNRQWNGDIDDIAIWNRPLTEDEIIQLSTAPLGSLLEGADFITFRAATADAAGFSVVAVDVGSAVANPDTLTVTLDGETITPNVTREGNLTTIRYSILADQGILFESGSEHTLALSIEATDGTPFTSEQTFTVAPYATIPADYALAENATVPGFVVNRVHQMTVPRSPNENSIASAEMQLAGGMTGADGVAHPNIAENAGPIPIGGADTGDFLWTPYVNWAQEGPFGPAITDNFNLTQPAGEPGTALGAYANEYFPGVQLVGSPPDPNNFVMETVAYVQLSAGLHRWGVNSDDGFKVTATPGSGSVFGVTLGQFDGGRGAADTIFDFVVEAAGYYPIRLLHWEGSGGANAEWFSVDLETGQKILIGDTEFYPTAAYQAFRTGQGRARVTTMRPSHGFAGTAPTGPIFVEITDGRTTASNARLFIDGEQVATGTKAGQVTTINYTPSEPWPHGGSRTGQLVYEESTIGEVTHNFTFEIRPFSLADLPADTFWIEVEDWDHGGGQTVAAASTMPYAGGAYEGLAGVLNVDYFDVQDNEDPGINRSYRTDQRPNHANLTVHEGAGVLAIERPGGFTVTSNYRLGWVGSFWGNYTRTIPAGNYRGVAALSHGSGAGTVMEADLDRVTDGVGTSDQTLERIGTFIGSGSTGWGSSVLVPLKTPSGADAIFTLPGGPVTLRLTARNGDVDWFALVPTTEEVPPDDIRIETITITPGGQIQIEWIGDGTLQSTTDLPATDWTDVTSSSPAIIDPPATGNLFFRVQN